MLVRAAGTQAPLRPLHPSLQGSQLWGTPTPAGLAPRQHGPCSRRQALDRPCSPGKVRDAEGTFLTAPPRQPRALAKGPSSLSLRPRARGVGCPQACPSWARARRSAWGRPMELSTFDEAGAAARFIDSGPDTRWRELARPRPPAPSPPHGRAHAGTRSTSATRPGSRQTLVPAAEDKGHRPDCSLRFPSRSPHSPSCPGDPGNWTQTPALGGAPTGALGPAGLWCVMGLPFSRDSHSRGATPGSGTARPLPHSRIAGEGARVSQAGEPRTKRQLPAGRGGGPGLCVPSSGR